MGGRILETQTESFFERALSNLSEAWRDIAASAARTVGRGDLVGLPRDRKALGKLMAECLEARGGEVSARMRAAELGESYLELDAEGRRIFFEILAKDFAVDPDLIAGRIEAYQGAAEAADKLALEADLRRALVPPRVKLLTQFNALPEGVKFLSDLRADLLRLDSDDPYLTGLERDLRDLLDSWFDMGFLDLHRITWDSPASLLEKLIAYEAVHAIQSWDDLRNRLDSDKRLYALFHPRMPEEPLAFIEVALVRGLTESIQALLDETAPAPDPKTIDSAIFYSISNTQKGLRGISFGEFLIKRVVEELSQDLPQIKTFATLSPLPGMMRWLERCPSDSLTPFFGEDERGGLRALGGSDDVAEALRAILGREDWVDDPVICTALREPLLRLCARYLSETRDDGQPIDPVARFHLKNGARLERINWLADSSPKGLAQSASMMLNYRYLVDEIEKNHESYIRAGKIAMSSEVKAQVKAVGGLDRAGSKAAKLSKSA